MDKRPIPDEVPPILIAIPDEWREEVRIFLEQKSVNVIEATTLEQTLEIVRSTLLNGLIVVSDWTLTDVNAKGECLIESVKDKIATVTLISTGGSYAWFERVYHPPNHEYCTIPFGLDELYSYMKRSGMVD